VAHTPLPAPTGSDPRGLTERPRSRTEPAWGCHA
jgi:hypothetical protein